MDLEPLEDLEPKPKPKKRKRKKKNVNVDASKKKAIITRQPLKPPHVQRTYEEWNKLRMKGKCTHCGKRKAKKPFLWCVTCSRLA